MAQHFLLSANARHLSIAQVSEMSDIDILKMLIKARWQQSDNLHHVICPRCQKCHNAYFNATRQQWRCKYCHYCFSITAGTIFHGSKLSLKQLLIALLLFTLNAKGISAVELSHSLNVQYKTAWVLLHKFRETLNQTKDISPLTGQVHIDGCYVNHYLRPKNFRHKRIDRRKKCYQRQDKACVLVFSQQDNQQQGANRHIVSLVKEENTHDIMQLTYQLVSPNTTIYTDENPAYNNLAFHYDLWRVNHSQEYCSIEGVTNNLAESFFARFRRMQYGVHHKFKNHYLMLYANEIVWREENRRKSVHDKFFDLLQRCLTTRPLKDFIGYWQKNKKQQVCFGLASL